MPTKARGPWSTCESTMAAMSARGAKPTATRGRCPRPDGVTPSLCRPTVGLSVAQQAAEGGTVLLVRVATGLSRLVRRHGASATSVLRDRQVARRLERGGLLGQVGVADAEVLSQEPEVRRHRAGQHGHDGQPLGGVEDGVEAVEGGGGGRHWSRARSRAAMAAYSCSYRATTAQAHAPAITAASPRVSRS